MAGVRGPENNGSAGASPVTFGTLAAIRHAASHPAVPPPTITTRSIAMFADARTLMGLHSLQLPEGRLRGCGTLAWESRESNLPQLEAHPHARHVSLLAGRDETHVVEGALVRPPAATRGSGVFDAHAVPPPALAGR